MIPAQFRAAWVIDTEYQPIDGEPPRPICLTGRELFSGRQCHLWLWGESAPEPPFDTGPDTLFICYSAPAEWNVFLELGWPLPRMVIDLYAEFRCAVSGIKGKPYGLAAAVQWYGLPFLDELFKANMKARCVKGGPFNVWEMQEILDYCAGDVRATIDLFRAMGPGIHWPHALIRGRYTRAVAHMERNGIPIDVMGYARLQDHWPLIRGELVREVDRDFGVFDGLEFDKHAFEHYLIRNEIPWPRLRSGRLELNQDVFSDMASIYPQLQPLSHLKATLSQLKEWRLSIGSDGRNRASLNQLGSKTGRNQPSNTKLIFGPAVWLRSFIKPEPGMALCYLDWEQQEFGIAAALSGDANMQAAYLTGDPYLSFAVQAGAAPAHATKRTHAAVRKQFKQCALGVQYCMGDRSLARQIQATTDHARELLRFHQLTFPRFWQWSEAAQDHAMLAGHLYTVFGWRVHAGLGANPRSFRNFPCQANAAEMLRLAASLAVERGIRVAAPVHDALLIEAEVHEIEHAVALCQGAMAEASRTVLDGFELRTEAGLIRHPGRFMDEERGRGMWDLVQNLLAKVGNFAPSHPSH
jgi:hypothetical protein